jgi:hypothetical protein
MKYIVECNGQSFITSNDMNSENLLREIEQECKMRNWQEYIVKEVEANVNN